MAEQFIQLIDDLYNLRHIRTIKPSFMDEGWRSAIQIKFNNSFSPDVYAVFDRRSDMLEALDDVQDSIMMEKKIIKIQNSPVKYEDG